MSDTSIRLDYGLMMAESQRLAALAEDTERLREALNGHLNRIPELWSGDACSAYGAAGRLTEQKMKVFANMLRTRSETLKRLANAYLAAEKNIRESISLS